MAKQNHFSQYCEITPKVGSYIEPDDWARGSRLIASDWEMADFRLPTSIAEWAVKVKVTGKVVRWPFGVHDGPFVRVEITFVGDCEPDTTAHGWMAVDDSNRVYTD